MGRKFFEKRNYREEISMKASYGSDIKGMIQLGGHGKKQPGVASDPAGAGSQRAFPGWTDKLQTLLLNINLDAAVAYESRQLPRVAGREKNHTKRGGITHIQIV